MKCERNSFNSDAKVYNVMWFCYKLLYRHVGHLLTPIMEAILFSGANEYGASGDLINYIHWKSISRWQNCNRL